MLTFRRVALALVLLLGVGLIVFPLADGLPEKTQGVDDVQDTFRDTMSKQGIQTSRDDLVTVEAMLAQLQTQTLPDIAQSRGVPTEALKGLLALRFPAVGKGLNEVGVIMPRFEETVSVMEQQGPNFREADQIPTADVPNTAVTYLFLVPGIILTVAGAAGLFFSFRGGRSVIPTVALATAVAMGAVLVIGTLVTDQIGKTKAAEKMFDGFRPTFTDASYQQKRADLNTLEAFAAEMQNDTIPFLASQAQQDVPTYTASLAARYPQVGKGLQETPRILGRFDGMVEDIGSNIESFKHADSIPTADTPVSQVPWYLLIPGIGLIAVAGTALLPLGRRDGNAPVGPEAPSGTPTPV